MITIAKRDSILYIKEGKFGTLKFCRRPRRLMPFMLFPNRPVSPSWPQFSRPSSFCPPAFSPCPRIYALEAPCPGALRFSCLTVRAGSDIILNRILTASWHLRSVSESVGLAAKLRKDTYSMKKFVLMAIAALAAVFANATQCQWSANGITQPSDGHDDLVPYTNFKLYLCDGAVLSRADAIDALNKGDTTILNKEGFVQQTSGTVQQGTTTNAKMMTLKFGNYAPGTSHSFYVVIFDDDPASACHYMVSAQKTATTPSTGTLSMSFSYLAADANCTGWKPIPEPTTGLLVLVGIAGIALKRKVA